MYFFVDLAGDEAAVWVGPVEVSFVAFGAFFDFFFAPLFLVAVSEADLVPGLLEFVDDAGEGGFV